MALGRRQEERQQEMWVATDQLPRTEGHVFYRKLNELLAEVDIDRFVEEIRRSPNSIVRCPIRSKLC